MFKFSQLVSRACKPISLEQLLQSNCICQKILGYQLSSSTSSSQKKRRSSKQRSTSRKKFSGPEVTGSHSTMQDESAPCIAEDKNLSSMSQSCSTNSSVPSGQETNARRDFEEIHFASDINKMGSTSDQSKGTLFTFMSYNILAQDLLQTHPYLYKSCNPKHLEWKFRLDRLASEILAIRPDILCLQEVQQNHIPSILKALSALNFEHIFKKKTGMKTDGCAILYNKNVFDLVEKHTVEYYQPNVRYLDRENVALIAKLCLKQQPSSCFIASTTHLLYNPRRQDVRLAQIQLLLAELDHISFKGFDCQGKIRRLPILLSGDFNLKPHSAPYNLLTQGNLAYHNLTQRTLEPPTDANLATTGHIFLPSELGINDNCQHYDVVSQSYKGQARIQNTDKNRMLDENRDFSNKNPDEKDPHNLFATGQLRHALNLVSVYDHHNRSEATTFQDKWVTVDYIFYSQHFSPSVDSDYDGYLILQSRYSLPSKKDCYKMNLVIPNAYLGSDHLSLAGKFYFQGPKSNGKECVPKDK